MPSGIRVCGELRALLAFLKDANVRDASSVPSRPDVARIPHAAHRLCVSESTIRRLIKAGELKTVKLGPRAVGITHAEISRFLAAQQ